MATGRDAYHRLEMSHLLLEMCTFAPQHCKFVKNQWWSSSHAYICCPVLYRGIYKEYPGEYIQEMQMSNANAYIDGPVLWSVTQWFMCIYEWEHWTASMYHNKCRDFKMFKEGVHTVLSRWMCNLGPSCLVHIGASQMVCRWGRSMPRIWPSLVLRCTGVCKMHWDTLQYTKGVCTPRQTGARLGTPRLKWCIKICKCAHDHFGTATTIQGFGCREAFGWSQFMCLSLKL